MQVIAEVVGQVAQHLQQDRRDQRKSEHRPAKDVMECSQRTARGDTAHRQGQRAQAEGVEPVFHFYLNSFRMCLNGRKLHGSIFSICSDSTSVTYLYVSIREAMTVKLTLSIPPDFKKTATLLSLRRKKSISALFVELLAREAEKDIDQYGEIRGIWKDRDITAEEIRERAWKRS